MRILALDISTKSGYCLIDNGHFKAYGEFSVDYTPRQSDLPYPYDVKHFIESYTDAFVSKLLELDISNLDMIVVEETTPSRSSQSQRVLEWIHYSILNFFKNQQLSHKIRYVKTGTWRKSIEMKMSKEDKKNNSIISKAKKHIKLNKLSAQEARSYLTSIKKENNIKGQINKKHLAIRYANSILGKAFKMKDNNTCDAICIAYAASQGNIEFVTYNNRKEE